MPPGPVDRANSWANVSIVNEALARQRLAEILSLIDDMGVLYDRRWGHGIFGGRDQPGLSASLSSKTDETRARVKLAHDIVSAMGEKSLLLEIAEHPQPYTHSFTRARVAIIQAIAIIEQREELLEIVGPSGPRLTAAELNESIWSSAARLWDDGHLRASVQTAATTLEGLLQSMAGPGVSGEGLGLLFSVAEPTPDAPRLRIRGVDPESKIWRSAHEGAAALVRGAFMGVRNLVSHPGWPEPEEAEALQMISVLSYVANLVEKSDLIRSD